MEIDSDKFIDILKTGNAYRSGFRKLEREGSQRKAILDLSSKPLSDGVNQI